MKKYIYSSFETMYAFDIFYKSNTGNFLMLHQLPLNKIAEVELDELIFKVLEIGNKDLQELDKICQKYNRPMPTQIKIIYRVDDRSVDAMYSYDKFYSDSDTLTPDDIFEQWFKEVQQKRVH